MSRNPYLNLVSLLAGCLEFTTLSYGLAISQTPFSQNDLYDLILCENKGIFARAAKDIRTPFDNDSGSGSGSISENDRNNNR